MRVDGIESALAIKHGEAMSKIQMALARKAKDMVEAEGQMIEELINSASINPDPRGDVGNVIDTHA